MFTRKYKSWKRSFEQRHLYSTQDMRPFYELAARHLPADERATVVDLGCGEGGFADLLRLATRYKHLFMLDGNLDTLAQLKTGYGNVLLYRPPDRLPFDDARVDYIHCSHMIEHLEWHQLYLLLKEMDRVLKDRGVLVISSPMMWHAFYDDLSHVRPYNPDVLCHYLCGSPGEQRSANPISEKYSILELTYRYTTDVERDEGWGSQLAPLDFAIHLWKAILLRLPLKRYRRNGYTLVVQKNA